MLGNPRRRLDFFVDGIARAVQPEAGEDDEQAGSERSEDDADAGVQAEPPRSSPFKGEAGWGMGVSDDS
ncbi:MAG: hypothetical protein CVU31_10990 [Betaproteobacteria bacterium HGW-Betaproteobacteria-4]|nr:MAG: hypothetical protein CVU31_10990 [Betaproteobacteria bacterium HGW-Betaproteobacteria-4]